MAAAASHRSRHHLCHHHQLRRSRLLFVAPPDPIHYHQLCGQWTHRRRPRLVHVHADGGRKRRKIDDAEARAAWVVTERISNVIGRLFVEDREDEGSDTATTLDDVMDAIRVDVEEKNYFVTGDFSCPGVYREDCEFVDDFSSFRGFKRFRQNLYALKLFTESYDVEILSFQMEGDGAAVETRAFVRLNLLLPWRPVLAWVWKVRHSIDAVTHGEDGESVVYRVVRHTESWEIDSTKGVELLLKPGPEAKWPWRWSKR